MNTADLHLPRSFTGYLYAVYSLDRGDIELYEPNSKKGILRRNFIVHQIQSGADPGGGGGSQGPEDPPKPLVEGGLRPACTLQKYHN